MYRCLRSFRIFPRSDGAVMIDWEKPLVPAFHQMLSEVGRLFTASYSAGRADEPLRYREGCLSPA